MEELIERIAKDVGITPDQVQKVIEVYVNFIKGELSDDCVKQIEGALRGGG